MLFRFFHTYVSRIFFSGWNALLKAWDDHHKSVINAHQQLMPITYANFGGYIQ
jgi:hypothetical protein